MLRIIAISALALAAASTAASTTANAAVSAGALECRGVNTQTFIIGSVTQMNCVFAPSAGGRQAYHATVHRFGVDLGFTSTSQVNWLVFAPTYRIGRGDLTGSYSGVSASASIGVGVGANALVGGSNNSFALQPVSFGGQTGLNVAGGIANLELVSVPVPPRHYRHHHRRHHYRHHH